MPETRVSTQVSKSSGDFVAASRRMPNEQSEGGPIA